MAAVTESGGRNAPADFRGVKRSNQTHRSTTDPDARLYRKGPGMEAKLCVIGHGLMENRSGLIVDARPSRLRPRRAAIRNLVRRLGMIGAKKEPDNAATQRISGT
jgi:hypothetical protein